jgi:hypothetical protein
LGRILIPWLIADRYFGYEARQARVEDGIQFELGHDLMDRKRPQFLSGANPAFQKFGVKFDFIATSEITAPLLEAAGASLQPDGLLVASWLASQEESVTKLRSQALAAGLEMTLLDRPHPSGHSWAAFYLPGCQNIPHDPPACATLASLEVIEEGVAGYLDFANDLGDYLLVVGWAIDPDTKSPASYVLFASGKTLRVDQQRPDLAAVHGRNYLGCGFRALVPKTLYGSCYAVTHSGKAYRLGS